MLTNIAERIMAVSPTYQLKTANCQTFAIDLAMRIVHRPNDDMVGVKQELSRPRDRGMGDRTGYADLQVSLAV